MTKKKRLFFSITCIILFLLVAPILALYSQGYKLDLEKMRFVATGGFYVQTENTSAQIYLDGRFERKTGILQNSALVKNLIPGDYQVKIEQEGFLSWEKTLPIYSQKITEIKNIFLLRKRLRFNLLAKNIREYLISPDGKELLLTIDNEEKWLIKTVSLENQEERKIIGAEYFEERNPIAAPSLSNWHPETKRILLSYTENGKNEYLLIKDYETEENKKIIPLNNIPDQAEKITLDASDARALFFFQDKTILRLEEGIAQPSPLLNNAISYLIKDGEIIWLSKSGFLYRSGLSGETREIINRKPFPVQEDSNYQIDFYRSDVVFLRESETLYYLSAAGTFDKISQGIKGLVLAPDQTRLAFWSNNEIWILDLIPDQRENYYGEENIDQEYREIFLSRFSKKIGDCFWLTPYHLIFNVEDDIKITEIDTRDRLNVFGLKSFKHPSIFFNRERDWLLVFAENNLFLFDSILD